MCFLTVKYTTSHIFTTIKILAKKGDIFISVKVNDSSLPLQFSDQPKYTYDITYIYIYTHLAFFLIINNLCICHFCTHISLHPLLPKKDRQKMYVGNNRLFALEYWRGHYRKYLQQKSLNTS